MIEPPPIPKITDPDLREAVNALTCAADVLRQIVADIISGIPKEEIMKAHLPRMLLAEKVIDHWVKEFEDQDFDLFSEN